MPPEIVEPSLQVGELAAQIAEHRPSLRPPATARAARAAAATALQAYAKTSPKRV